MVPVTLPSVPRTVDTIMCFTLNCAAVCAGSICQAVGLADAAACAGAGAAGAGGVWVYAGTTSTAAAATVRTNRCIGNSPGGRVRSDVKTPHPAKASQDAPVECVIEMVTESKRRLRANAPHLRVT